MRGGCATPLAALAVIFLPLGALKGQACCTLQGFNGNSITGSIEDFDAIDFADPNNRSQLQFQVYGSDDWDDWVRSNFISNGPVISATIGLNYFYIRSLMLNAGFSARTSTISEAFSIDGSATDVALTALHLRANWIAPSRDKIVWGMFTRPAVEVYSNRDFPFRTSVPPSIEAGFAAVATRVNRNGKPRLYSFRYQGLIEGKSDNLYRFGFYGTAQVSIKYRLTGKIVPLVSSLAKFGSLRPVTSDIYYTSFPATNFMYLLLGAGFEQRLSGRQDTVLRLIAHTPVLRWSDRVLPAGFDEKPIISLTVSRVFSIGKRQDLAEKS